MSNTIPFRAPAPYRLIAEIIGGLLLVIVGAGIAWAAQPAPTVERILVSRRMIDALGCPDGIQVERVASVTVVTCMGLVCPGGCK